MILAQQLILGLLVGGLYGLAAAGLSLTFGVLRVLNVAHGDLLMLGGYVTFWLFSLWHVDPFLSLAAVAPSLFFLGLILYCVLFRFVVRAREEVRIKNSLLIGFGLTLVFQILAIQFFTADERSVTTAYGGEAIKIAGLAIPLVRLASVVLAFLVLAALQIFLNRARWGRAIRATAEDWEAASLMGIPVGRAYLWAFALGTALAGVAGGLVSVSYSISPTIGLEWTLKALIVTVLAGLGSLFGSFAGGLLLGFAEAGSGLLLGGAYREAVGLGLFLIILITRPQGLFGSR
ncbi:MAG: branched-chain amino acid ABC transporter permease [Candidatus Tectomicrobia bacterium]|uniref:Branched-chain amino acid ABC transporter permease n=1 Tax=Tectimicrobiota bacterium TaxID=2528274 RepID=A0A932M0A7_UNCTE|nr:branched-chain amino acid ABC transporter permease [Candidatus Tectomicrobia bacterium]